MSYVDTLNAAYVEIAQAIREAGGTTGYAPNRVPVTFDTTRKISTLTFSVNFPQDKVSSLHMLDVEIAPVSVDSPLYRAEWKAWTKDRGETTVRDPAASAPLIVAAYEDAVGAYNARGRKAASGAPVLNAPALVTPQDRRPHQIRVHKVTEDDLDQLLVNVARERSPAFRAWLERRPEGEYDRWPASRVRRALAVALGAYAKPIAARAMALTAASEAAHAHVERFALAHHGLALMDSVQGGTVRVFSHDAWDHAIDVDTEASRTLAADPTRALDYLTHGGNVCYWPPVIPEGRVFPSLAALFLALDEASGQRYGQITHDMREGRNVTETPYRTRSALRPVIEEGRLLIASVVTFAVEKRKNAQDRLTILFHPLLTPGGNGGVGGLHTTSIRNLGSRPVAEPVGTGHDAIYRYQISAQAPGYGYGTTYEPVKDHTGTPLKPFYADMPVSYSVPLNLDTARGLKGGLRTALIRALQDAGYREARSAVHGVGPRAFALEHSLLSIRQPGGTD